MSDKRTMRKSDAGRKREGVVKKTAVGTKKGTLMRAISGAISQAMAPIHRKLASLESRIGDSASAYSGTSGGRPGSSRGAETATSSCDTQRALYSWLMPKERPIFPSKGMTPITF